MLYIEAVEDAVRSPEVRNALMHYIGALNAVKRKEEGVKWAAEQVQKAHDEMKLARAEEAKARAAFAAALANGVSNDQA